MIIVRIPGIFKKIYPGLIWNISAADRAVCLTFDDGPTPGITERVLSVLDEFRAVATFFCIGRNAERHPEILRQILEAGHEVGNHTYSHLKGWYTPNRQYFEDIELASEFIPSDLYRPAYGMITPCQVRYLRKEYRIVMWDVMSYDFHPRTSREKCLDHVIRYTKPGSVVVFHDSVKASEKLLFALPRALEYFMERGFTFKTI
jgi:peptidoglycan/xylan/chitin deacetylase (PgdA/CDA1 family)